MKNFFLALCEIIVLISYPFIAWLMVKFPNYIVFIYSLFIINIILFHFLKSSFLEVLTLVLSIFIGIATILLMPEEYNIDRIIVSFEMVGFVFSYFVLLKLDRMYERQKTLWVEKKENFEKEVTLLKIDLEKIQEEIYNNIIRIQNYKYLEEIVSKLSSFNEIKQLKKFLNEVFKNLLPNSFVKLYLSEEIIEDEQNVDNILINYCIKEGGLFYLPITIEWVERCENLQLKKYLQKLKIIKSIFCIKLESTNEQKVLGYIVGYSENYISEDKLRLISLLSTYISISISNIYLIKYMQELAITDSLTGLYVQRYFKELLEEEIKIARYYNRELSLAIFDLDNFKHINDTYGHNAGDEVLVRFANILKSRLRETDIISRYGGDEFAVIFPDTENKTAAKICEEIRNIVENEIVIPKEFIKKEKKLGSARIKFFISCGVCGFFDKFNSATEFFNYVDSLLYKAKKTGKNKVVVC